MPYNLTTGVYTPPAAAENAVAGKIIASADWNTVFTDLSTALTNVGQGTVGVIATGSVTSRTPVARLVNPINVKDYGAVGDGVTNDTAAINLAIAALNTASRGTLYFPAGNYLVPTGGLTTITAEGAVVGDGAVPFSNTNTNNFITLITQTSTTATLFTVNTSSSLLFRDIAIFNKTVVTPTTSIGILNLSTSASINYQRVSVNNFFNGIDSQAGQNWVMNSCWFAAVNYAMKINNVLNVDGGDWCISNSSFYGADSNFLTVNAVDLLHIIGSGGGKVINCKFNSFVNNKFAKGINIDYTGTVDFLVANCSIENFTGTAITASNVSNLLLTNIQVQANPGSGAPIQITSCNPCAVSNILGAAPGATNMVTNTNPANYAESGLTNSNGFGFTNQTWFQSIFLGGLDLNGVYMQHITTVSSLNAPPSGGGGRAIVSNATQSLSAGLGNVVAGGGGNIVPVYHDGTNWRIG